MNRAAEALLEQLRKLPINEQQEILQQLLRSHSSTPPNPQKPLPSIKVPGGPITSQRVAEAM
jgi:hypothetical protein